MKGRETLPNDTQTQTHAHILLHVIIIILSTKTFKMWRGVLEAGVVRNRLIFYTACLNWSLVIVGYCGRRNSDPSTGAQGR